MSQELLLDLTSPLPSLTMQDIRQWAQGKMVFISSTMVDLQPERKIAAQSIRDHGATPRFFEEFSSPNDPANVYVPEVNRADVYVLVLGERYGGVIASDQLGRSATHIEYDAAVRAFKPILVYRKDLDDSAREPKLLAWMRSLDQQHTVNRFKDQAGLEAAIQEGLSGLAAAQSRTWIKLGQALFPVVSHSESRGRFEIVTTTQDPKIVAHLKTLEHNRFGATLMVLGERAFEVKQLQVREESRGNFQRTYTLSVQAEAAPVKLHTYAQMVFNNRPPSEFVTSFIRAWLFGEAMPEVHGLGRWHEVKRDTYLPELFAALKDRHLADELFAPIARLYLTEKLLLGLERDSALTGQIFRLDISPVQHGRANVSLSISAPQGIGGPSTSASIELVGEIVVERQTERPIKDWH